jgi:hypothetical protein
MAEHGGGTYPAEGAEADKADAETESGKSVTAKTETRKTKVGGTKGETHAGLTKGDTDAGEAEAGEAEAGEAGDALVAAGIKHGPVMRNWRYVTGTFQVKIPVTTSEVMLRPDEDALAVMKWRLQQMAPGNRWHPVLERYISYLRARVAGLGGNPDEIPPSPDGAPIRDGTKPEATSYTGKVSEVIYDCFGRFEGFVLSGCCGDRRAFRSNEGAFAEVLLNACKACLLVTVYFERGNEECITRVVVHC